MERLLKQLVEKLTKAFGSRLKSVTLYGSAATGEYNGKYSDLNVLCVLEQVTPRELEDSSAIVRWWREQGNPSPLLLSEEEIRRSADCFPIEFTDIRDHRRVLQGADVCAELAIDKRHYRAQVEHELRAKLLRLRQRAAGVLNDPELLRRLMAESVSTFCVLFRHALALAGVAVQGSKREAVEQAREHFGIEPAPLLKLLDLREEKIKPQDLEPAAVLAAYMRQIQTVIAAVDRLER